MPLPDILTSLLRDLAAYDFWRHAVIGGVAIAVACSLLSVYVVLKRMAFVGQGISHSAFGGIALGVLLFGGSTAAEPLVYATALAFCLVVALMIAAITRHTKISEDSAIGIFFVVSMALGVVFFKSAKGYNRDVYSFLFGSILALTQAELIAMCALAATVTALLLLFEKELLYYTFDEEMAAVSGIPVNALHIMLLCALSLTIVISVRMIGIILISAFLIMPGAIAQLLVQGFRAMVIAAVTIGVLTTIAGIVVSYATDWPSGAAVVLVQFAVFMLVFVVRRAQGRATV